MLETEILRKMNKPEKEIVGAGFNADAELQAAISIVSDRELYNRFLNISR